MWYLLKRHPVAIKAFFRNSIVLTYAFPEEVLRPLLPPGLSLDSYQGFGFVAIAMVQTQALRPAFLPNICGRDFFLCGYRIFTKFKTQSGRHLRGLRILRSYTDDARMVFFGNILTHYNYKQAKVSTCERANSLEIQVTTPLHEADIHVVANFTQSSSLPPNSPFPSMRIARLFAGPLPFTFDYEEETKSIIMIEGVRSNWKPLPMDVEIKQNTFFNRAPFNQTQPILANAFHVKGIPYLWKRGVREPLGDLHE